VEVLPLLAHGPTASLPGLDEPPERADVARDLLRRSGRLLDLGFRVDLRAIADGDLDDLEERRRGPDTP
jgi:hypothetical protein